MLFLTVLPRIYGSWRKDGASLNTLQQYVPFNSVCAMGSGCAEVPVWWLGTGMTMLIVVSFPHSAPTYCFAAPNTKTIVIRM